MSRGPAPSAEHMDAPREHLYPFPPLRPWFPTAERARARDTALQRGSRGQNGEGGTWLVPVHPPLGGEGRTTCPGSRTQVMEGPFLPQPVVHPKESQNEGVQLLQDVQARSEPGCSARGRWEEVWPHSELRQVRQQEAKMAKDGQGILAQKQCLPVLTSHLLREAQGAMLCPMC